MLEDSTGGEVESIPQVFCGIRTKVVGKRLGNLGTLNRKSPLGNLYEYRAFLTLGRDICYDHLYAVDFVDQKSLYFILI